MKREELHNFLYFMVHNKSLTKEQQTRRNKLIETLALPLVELSEQETNKLKTFSPLSPYTCFCFLAGFNDPFKLKYLTHDFDLGRDDNRPTSWNEVVEQVVKLWRTRCKEDRIPYSLWHLFNNFIFGKQAWIDDYGKEHNSHIGNKEWKDWCIANNTHPLKNATFEKEIVSFKRTTRIRNTLNEIVNQISRESAVEIKTKKLAAADFYTNTLIVYNVIKRIIEQTMKPKIAGYPDIRIEFSRDVIGEWKMQVVTISQIGSYSSKSIQDAISRLKDSPESGDFGSIRDDLNGYCLWTVESLWDGEPKRWNILREPTTEKPEVEDINADAINGFTHILKFYQS